MALCKVTVLICMLIGALASQEPAAPSNLNDDPVVALEGALDEATSVGGPAPAQILEQHGEAQLAAEQQQQQQQQLGDGGSGVHDQAVGGSGEGGAPHSGSGPAEELPAEQLAAAQPEAAPQQQQVEQQPEENPSTAGQPAAAAGAGKVPPAAAGDAAAAEQAARLAPSPPEQPPSATEPPAAALPAAEPPAAAPTPPAPEQQQPSAAEPPAPAPEPETIPEEELRNFALTKDGAKVVAANKEAKKLSALLDGDSDTYVKNDCKADKWFIIELSQVAKISRVELAQYELYSSRVKSFEVRGRQTHPRVDGVEISKGLNSTQWRLLGALMAENKKGSQRFALERPMWARYLLLQLQSHYGSEPVCAINGFAAYGKSAAEEFEDHLASQESLQYLHSTLDHELAAAVPVPPAQEPPVVPPAVPAAAQPAAPAAAAAAAAGSGAPGAREGIVEPAGTQAEPAAAEQAAAAAAAGAPAPSPGAVAAPCVGTVGEGSEAAVAPAMAAAPGDTAGSDPSGSCGSEAGQECIGAAAPACGAAAGGVGSAGEAGGESAGSGAAGEAAAAEAGLAAPGAAAAVGQELGSAPSGSAGTQGQQQGDVGAASPAPAPAIEQEASAGAADSQQQQQQPQATGSSAQQAPAAPAAEQNTAQQQPPAQQQGGAAAGGSAETIPSVLTWAPKAKGSASIYDIMLQEIKTTKVQQKLMSRSIADLQRNATALHGELAADIVSVAAQLAKVQKESNQTEELVLAKVEAMVDARMRRLSQEIAALQVATSASAKREVAVLCLLGLLGAAVALGMPAGGKGAGWVKWVVAALAVSNGAVAVLLQCRAASGWGPVAVLQALPSE